jgi:hypothetical protein
MGYEVIMDPGGREKLMKIFHKNTNDGGKTGVRNISTCRTLTLLIAGEISVHLLSVKAAMLHVVTCCGVSHRLCMDSFSDFNFFVTSSLVVCSCVCV